MLFRSPSSTVLSPLSSPWQDTPSRRHTEGHRVCTARSSSDRASSPLLNSDWRLPGRSGFDSPSGKRLAKEDGYLPAQSSREHGELSEDIPGQPGREGEEVRHRRRRSLTPSPHVALHWLHGCHSPQVSARTSARLLMLAHLRIRI